MATVELQEFTDLLESAADDPDSFQPGERSAADDMNLVAAGVNLETRLRLYLNAHPELFSDPDFSTAMDQMYEAVSRGEKGQNQVIELAKYFYNKAPSVFDAQDRDKVDALQVKALQKLLECADKVETSQAKELVEFVLGKVAFSNHTQPYLDLRTQAINKGLDLVDALTIVDSDSTVEWVLGMHSYAANEDQETQTLNKALALLQSEDCLTLATSIDLAIEICLRSQNPEQRKDAIEELFKRIDKMDLRGAIHVLDFIYDAAEDLDQKTRAEEIRTKKQRELGRLRLSTLSVTPI